MKKQQLFYTIRRGGDSRYAHVFVGLYRLCDVGHSHPTAILTIQWQSDPDTDHWYCPHAEVRSENCGPSIAPLLQFQLAARTLAGFPLCENPADYIAQLAVGDVPLYWYDPRVSEYLPPDRVLAPEFRRWVVSNGSGCIASTMANGQDDAKDRLLKEFGRQVEQSEVQS